MSKRSLFWGQASGKLGEAVFYRAGGEQRTRAYVKAVKNPKTLAQMKQRITMGNLVSMYSAYKPILSQSFPNRASNRSAFNEFVSANKNSNSYAIFKEDVANRYFWPVGLTVSKGSLTIPTSLQFHPMEDSYEDLGWPFSEWNVLNEGVSAKSIGIDVTDYVGDEPQEFMHFKELSPYQVYKLLTANGNPYGLPSSFVITIMAGSLDAGMTPEDDANGLCTAAYTQYYCSSVEADCKVVNVGNEIVSGLSRIGVADCEVNSAGDDVIIYSITAGYGLKYSKMAVAVIVSFKSDSALQITSSKFHGDQDMIEASASLLPGGPDYERILADYGYNSDSILV